MANGSVMSYVEARRAADATTRTGHGLRSLQARVIETARLLRGVHSQLNDLEETATALWSHYESLNAELTRRSESLMSLRRDMPRQGRSDGARE